jgi:hypothetical protein
MSRLKAIGTTQSTVEGDQDRNNINLRETPKVILVLKRYRWTIV